MYRVVICLVIIVFLIQGGLNQTLNQTLNLTPGQLRLVGPRDSGRLEIFRNGEWGTVCSVGFDVYEADLACVQLGYLYANRVDRVQNLGFPEGSGNIWLKNVTCSLSAQYLNNCTTGQVNNTMCDNHTFDAAIICSNNANEVRLLSSTGDDVNDLMGLLQISINEQWGTVCDFNFGDSEADVACRQLGFSRASSYKKNDVMIPRLNLLPIWLTNLNCSMMPDGGNLRECMHAGTGIRGSCQHDDDIVLVCDGEDNDDGEGSSESITTTGFPLINNEAPADTSTTVIALSSTSAMVIILIASTVVVVAVIGYSKSMKKKLNHARNQIMLNRVNVHENNYTSKLSRSDSTHHHNNMTVRSSFKLTLSNHLIIESCNLKLKEPVGQGEFGIVYKGQLFKKSINQTVAVKTLKGFMDKKNVRQLLQECTKMSTFDHPNVLPLTGVCLDGGPAPYIVMPFMFNGSLLAYLKKERDNLVLPPETEGDDGNIANVSSKLINFVLQVAKGMEYLSSKKVIHRDLAARNCMIDMNFVIKVSDFGLSESIDSSKDYFRPDEDDCNVMLPVKWLAPECFNDHKFSEKSDVWAFGVTCWEVFSGGKAPYAAVKPMELPKLLEDGYRLEKPKNAACPDSIFDDVMWDCWKDKPEERPHFSDIVTALSQYLGSIAGYIVLSNVDDENIMEVELDFS